MTYGNCLYFLTENELKGRSWRLKKFSVGLGPVIAIVFFLVPGSLLVGVSTPQSSQSHVPAMMDDWSPEALYRILSSPDSEAKDNLYRAAFAAGSAIIPHLQAALKDDRIAEFAAQSLAFLGGPQARTILATLLDDPRNLDLRRFYYGSLAEYNDPQSIGILLDAVRRSDREPDRTVTRAAILALSVHSDPSLAAQLREAEKDVSDYVIQDDIETAESVIELRAKYLSSLKEKDPKNSVNAAVRIYFIPALEGPPPGTPQDAAPPHADFRIPNVTYSPDKSRALADVIFETPDALANYRFVLQKKQGGWTVASVWLGAEREKQQPDAQSAKPQ
jgi:hypothetical protein